MPYRFNGDATPCDAMQYVGVYCRSQNAIFPKIVFPFSTQPSDVLWSVGGGERVAKYCGGKICQQAVLSPIPQGLQFSYSSKLAIDN